MPNWCMNILTVEGTADELKQFVFSSQGLPAKYPLQEWEKSLYKEDQEPTEPYFCFNSLIPTPEAVLQMGYDASDKIPQNALLLALTGQSFNPMDGYHWNILNWGTKWDVYADRITPEKMGWSEGCNRIEFGFDTAWSPPAQWLIKITKLFPSLSFVLHYEEPGGYFAGDLIYRNGVLKDIPYDDEQCSKLFGEIDEESEEDILM